MSLIFYISYESVIYKSSILSSMLTTSIINFALFINITPFAIGILESIVYFANINFNINLSETIVATSIYRVSLILFYLPIGLFAIFYLKKNLESFFRKN